MKNHFHTLFAFAFISFLLSSCSYSSYIPVTVYEPMLSKQGDRQGVAYIGANHVEVQGAYAVTKHFAVQGDVWRGVDKRYSMDLLPGYYYHAPKGFCIGIYAGGGMANTSGTKEIEYSNGFNPVNEKRSNQVRYTSMVFQPSAGYKTKNFEVGFASRISYVYFSQYHASFSSWTDEHADNPEIVNEYNHNGFGIWVFQPALNMAVGMEHVIHIFNFSCFHQD
jgi:hypothetical protein